MDVKGRVLDDAGKGVATEVDLSFNDAVKQVPVVKQLTSASDGTFSYRYKQAYRGSVTPTVPANPTQGIAAPSSFVPMALQLESVPRVKLRKLGGGRIELTVTVVRPRTDGKLFVATRLDSPNGGFAVVPQKRPNRKGKAIFKLPAGVTGKLRAGFEPATPGLSRAVDVLFRR